MAIEARPDYAEAYNNRGNAFKELKRFEEALAAFDAAIAIKPSNAESYVNRGTVLQELKLLDEALASYDHAIALKPASAEAQNNRGNVLKELNRFEEALASYDRALHLKPDYADALHDRAVALIELGQLNAATRDIEAAVELMPGKPRYHRARGEIIRYRAGDRYVATMEELARNSMSLSNDDRIELHFGLAKAYEDLGQNQASFDQLVKGNLLRRQQITYSEDKTLGLIEKTGEIFTAQFINHWSDRGNNSSVPVFIVGMPRSGSTLVEQILASHPQVFGGGELKHFPATVEEIRNEKFGDSISIPTGPSAMTESDLRVLGDRYLERILRLAPAAAHITDKLTGNFALAGLIHLALPNAVIIHTVRDPLDTCMSCFSKLFGGGTLSYTYDLQELGRYYRHYRALMDHWHRVLPRGRILDVQYEDVVADLEGQARRILAHCALDWDPACLSFHRTDRPVRTVSATQVRQPLYSGAVGRGRAYERFLSPLLAELNARHANRKD
jgi:Tfp pilus assembly protein PilF